MDDGGGRGCGGFVVGDVGSGGVGGCLECGLVGDGCCDVRGGCSVDVLGDVINKYFDGFDFVFYVFGIEGYGLVVDGDLEVAWVDGFVDDGEDEVELSVFDELAEYLEFIVGVHFGILV